ncbi:MAG TPA: Ig-like domain repeat protein, partial [Tepidiformaceae bacterium]|nr:Ig-like domain repeat protein [Tepidiformaceae bacterium]
TVQFRVRPAGGTASSEENLGTPVPLTEDAGVWTATLPATLTGEDNTVLENSGNFEVRAVFAETATLASVTSAAFPFSIGPEAPGITVTLPDTDPGTAGNQVQAGQAQNIQVQLSGSRTPRLNNSGNSSSGLSVTVLNNGLSIGTAAINEQGAATFSVAGLNAGTYSITVSYPGNLYYSPLPPTPAQTLTITQITPVVTVNAITAEIGTNVSLTATVPAGSGVTSPAGGSISFYVGSVGAGNLLGTDTTLTSGGAVLTATLSVPTGDGQALSTADTAYTIIAQYNGNATNGNFAVSTSTANATNSKSVTLTKRSSSATVPAGSGQRSTQITLNATVAATGSPTTSIAPTCSNCLQFQVQVDATGGPSSNGQWTNIPGALVDVASNGAASATFLVPTPGPNALFTAAGAYNVRAVYNGNSNLNNVTSSAAVFTLTLAQPTVAVSAIPNVTIGNTFSITATVSGSGTTDPAGGTVTFRLGTTVLGTATVSSGAATLTGIPTGPGTNFQSPTGTGVSYDNITARFNGDAANGNVGAVTSPAASVVINKANVTLNVTYPAGNTVVVGTNAVITATLTGFHPGSLANNGARIFFENGGSGMLGGTVEVTQISAGVWGATFNVQNLNASTYGITARYEGNAIYNAATSPETAFVVTQFTPTVTITSPTSPHTVTSPTQVSITVSVPGTGMRSPVGGTVSLLIGDTVIATSAALTGTTATFNLTTTGGGTLPASGSPYTIVARFNGNTNLNQATSASITVNVNPAGP